MSNGKPVNDARSLAHIMDAPFFRFSPIFECDMEFGENNIDVICERIWDTLAYMETDKKTINDIKILQKLVS